MLFADFVVPGGNNVIGRQDECVMWRRDARGMAMSEQSGTGQSAGQRSAEDQSGTHSACTSHRCSSWTGAPCPHSPSPRFWVSERCILSSSSGCTLSHRWTTYSTLSTGRPLPRNRQGRTGVERMASQMR